ncbi:uracil-DNA glycosylase family protein [Flammeovirga sp. SubArs3]|uniref:uracil-DNA glycosylase family protein n=1 Tax=Flammeovirga sp. SubArs3 TaxID=2995316 RepID=UPI00248BDE61|nr:uracil-DNA glycosylase family protein [Flammeovirga sp. SubArs3]
MDSAQLLLEEIINSDICKGCSPPDAKPLLNFSSKSKILIIGQAPGIKAIESGIPWNDASGRRLREWMEISDKDFYDKEKVAIVPMDFCFPGKGKSGDLPPRPICAKQWMGKIMKELQNIELTLLIGQYAQKYFLAERRQETLTSTVKNWKSYYPHYFVMPHPSPRNNIWLKKNDWFEIELLPVLKSEVKRICK